jgi:ribosomal-protein-alanine N-acetyltransferase
LTAIEAIGTEVREHYIIEPMRLEDLTEVVAIEKATFPNPWPRESFKYEIEKNPFSYPTVARTKGNDGAEVAGYCVKWVVFDYMHIQNIAVHPEHQRRGLGRFLLEEALMRGKRLGAKFVQLEVRESNLAAQRLYISMGFRKVGKRKRYYSNPREDALLFQKNYGEKD